MKYKLKQNASAWDSTGKAPQSGFNGALLLAGTKNHRGLVPIRCEQTGRRAWAKLEDLEVVADGRTA